MIANRELNQSSHDQVLVSAQESIQGQDRYGKAQGVFSKQKDTLKKKVQVN